MYIYSLFYVCVCVCIKSVFKSNIFFSLSFWLILWQIHGAKDLVDVILNIVNLYFLLQHPLSSIFMVEFRKEFQLLSSLPDTFWGNFSGRAQKDYF